MKQFLLSASALLLSGALMSQQFTPNWIRQFAGPNAQTSRQIAVDNAGNSISCGWFEGVVDFDPGDFSAVSSSQGAKDAFIVKLNGQGVYQWHYAIGSSQDDLAYDVDVDGVGNVYVTGEFRGTVNFNPAGSTTLTAFNGYNSFVLKIAADGNFEWVRKFGGTNSGYESGRAIDVDASGNIVSSGVFYGAVDFNPGAGINELNFSNSYACYVSKLTTTGDFVWAKGFPGFYTNPVEIKQDGTSNVFIVGTFYSNVDFDPGMASFTLVGQYYDTFITKLNSLGDFVWAKHFTSSSTCNTTEIEFDAAGNIYGVGHHNGTTDFNPDLVATEIVSAPSGSWRPFLVKLNSLGMLQFVKQLSPNAVGTAQALEFDNQGNMLIAGTFYGTSDFNPDPIDEFPMTSVNTSTDDIYITRLDADANFVFAVTIGGSSADLVTGLDMNPANNITTLFGTFSGTCDFLPGINQATLVANGSTDNFIAQYLQCLPTQASIEETACGSATINNLTYTTSGEYVQILTSFFGCDSTLTIDLTINQPSFADLTLYTTDVITYNDVLYTEAGNYTQTFTNVNGCDSTLFIDVIILDDDFEVSQNGNELMSTQSGDSYQWVDCNNNNEPIPNATDAIFNPGQSGNYAVIVYGDEGEVMSDCINFTFVSSEEILVNEIAIFPNPTRDILNIQGLRGDEQIRVVDASGRIVLLETANGRLSLPLHVQPLETGLYILQVIGGSNTFNIHILKN